ncbi:glucan endo-1,3-beta-glucosidase 11-like isoform X1 [Phoenix dactylifera]|uniref:glucan endo-1,3-beta-D-glucosidase n=1 Tax=Phoenix dactylifera TaxID=42345 RepID=A0A8B8J2E6_PHODC|nr:glucan endo-1,3-beta-glucosidase 11-like isoform X2 [Phoenix dactylifera]XP_038985088.1 glucan endo-1,3-beta-glucosidase 11-like isoform X1 [Phoenix dactylifera]
MPASIFSRSRMIPIFLLFNLFYSEFGFLQLGSTLGINYGQVANNLPPPEQVVTLLNSLSITKTRIYDTNPQVLTAFANSGIDLVVTVPNEVVPQVTDPQQALQWVMTNIKPYFPATRISGIAVGNEVFTSDDTALASNLVPAMHSLHAALVQLGLDSYVHISTANSLGVLQNSYPPSFGSFRPELANLLLPFLQFLAETNSPFWINAYPYFAYKGDPDGVPLDYVLLNPNQGMVDPYTKLHYDNMLYAQVDAVIFAMSRMGYGGLEVRVSETGWPSKGDPDEIGANVENARAHNRNLLLRQMRNQGTPLRPDRRLEVYLFALFNEDMKPGPTSERNYGLYQPDGTMAYNVGLGKLTSAASVNLISSATRETGKELGSSWYWIFLFSLTFPALMRRAI